MKQIIFAVLALLFVADLQAQEFNFQVTINTPKLQTADPKVFETLESAIEEFMNTTNWADDVFELDERINGSIVININEEKSATRFTAEMAIQAVRPVYNSTYETVLLTYQDNNVWFDYEQYQPLVFSQNTFNDNLTATLGFYAYIILGMDYDSFSPLGGQEHFQTAQEIVNNIPPGAASISPKGWRSLDGNRNRFWMIENLLSPRVRPYRQAMYDYHRQGLDIMHEDPAAGRAIIADALEAVDEVNRAYPNSMIIQMFSDAKGDEIAEIFKQSTPQEKNKVIQIMSRVDAAKVSKYQAIR